MKLLFEGITHLEDLGVNEFLRAVKLGNQMRVTEKLDGINMVFGFDEKGEFYTSREVKGGKRFYQESDWGKDHWNVGFRGAHLALQKVAPRIRKSRAMRAGDAVECEILFGAMPNTVPYSGDSNQIVFLAPFSGTPDISKLHSLLDGKTVNVAVEKVPYTEDGKTFKYHTQTYTWRFVQVPSVDKKLLSKAFGEKELAFKIEELEKFLKAPSGIADFTNAEVISIPLNKRPEKVDKNKWSIVVNEIKQKRQDLIKQLSTFKLDIKEQLLDSLVRNVSSAFGPNVRDGGWIEGLVFRDPDTNRLFKLVDKNVFTMFNRFNWAMRELLKSTGGKKLSSILGRMYLRMAESIGHPRLATGIGGQYVRSLGKSGEEILDKLSDGVDLEETKKNWLEQLDRAEKVAQRVFDWYQNNKQKLSKQVQMGSKTYQMKYEGVVDEKTLQSFAAVFEEIRSVRQSIQNAKTPAQLVSLLVKPEYLNVS